jgi:hypothetical protein
MRLVLYALDSAAAHAGDRSSVVRAALRPRMWRSLVGRHPVAATGDAGWPRFAGYRRADGRLAFLGLRAAP